MAQEQKPTGQVAQCAQRLHRIPAPSPLLLAALFTASVISVAGEPLGSDGTTPVSFLIAAVATSTAFVIQFLKTGQTPDAKIPDIPVVQPSELLSSAGGQFEKLIADRRRAEEANESKSAFLANMTHELRTPLNAVIGYAELLGDRRKSGARHDPDAVSRYAESIQKSGAHLLSIVNDLLDLSKIEAGRMTLTPVRLSIGAVFEEVEQCMRPLAQDRDQTVDFVCDYPETSFMADRRATHQILLNLVSNALKYSPKGSTVTVEARLGDTLSIVVSDKGTGMTDAEVAVALQPFGQLENAQDCPMKGTGLGLPLASELIAMEGGRLEISSSPNVGTVVSIHYPESAAVSEVIPFAMYA